MSVISIIRFFRVTVRFSIRDGFLERFINLCAQNRVPIWEGRREGNRYTACTVNFLNNLFNRRVFDRCKKIG